MLVDIEKNYAVLTDNKGLKVVHCDDLSDNYLERQKKNLFYLLFYQDKSEEVKQWNLLKLITQINEILQNRINQGACTAAECNHEFVWDKNYINNYACWKCGFVKRTSFIH